MKVKIFLPDLGSHLPNLILNSQDIWDKSALTKV